MVKGTIEDIREEARRLVEALGRFNGGFIACCDEGIDHGYIEMEKIEAMGMAFEGFSKNFGRFKSGGNLYAP
ncbi:MAG: hypothetical protein ACUVXI_05970 [bacterium]